MRYRVVRRVIPQGQSSRDLLAESLRRAAATINKGWGALAVSAPEKTPEESGLHRENEELRRENNELLESNTALRIACDELLTTCTKHRTEREKLQADWEGTTAKLDNVELELSKLKESVAKNEMGRAEFEPFWALATSESRLLLVSAHFRGPLEFDEIIESADANPDILESVCRLRIAGLIKFDGLRIVTTPAGEAILNRLGFLQ